MRLSGDGCAAVACLCAGFSLARSHPLACYRGETKVLRQFVASKLIHESAAVVVGVFALRAVGEKEKEEGGLLFASPQTPFSFLPSSSSFHVVEMQIKVAEEEEKRKRGDEGHANQRRSWNQRKGKKFKEDCYYRSLILCQAGTNRQLGEGLPLKRRGSTFPFLLSPVHSVQQYSGINFCGLGRSY